MFSEDDSVPKHKLTLIKDSDSHREAKRQTKDELPHINLHLELKNSLNKRFSLAFQDKETATREDTSLPRETELLQ